MIPVRYELNIQIALRSNTVFKGLKVASTDMGEFIRCITQWLRQ
jgi:hypothetical protein